MKNSEGPDVHNGDFVWVYADAKEETTEGHVAFAFNDIPGFWYCIWYAGMNIRHGSRIEAARIRKIDPR